MNLQATSQILVEQTAKKDFQSSLITRLNMCLAYHQVASFPLLLPLTAFSNIQLSDLMYGRSGHVGFLVVKDCLVIIECIR